MNGLNHLGGQSTEFQGVGLGTSKVSKDNHYSSAKVDSKIAQIGKNNLPLSSLNPHNLVSSNKNMPGLAVSHQITHQSKGKTDAKTADVTKKNPTFESINSNLDSSANEEISNNVEHLEAELNDLFEELENVNDDHRKVEIESKIALISSKLSETQSELGEVKTELGEVKTELGEVKSELKAGEMELVGSQLKVEEHESKVVEHEHKLGAHEHKTEGKFKKEERELNKTGGELHAGKGRHGIGAAAHQALDKMKGLVDEVNQLKNGFIKELSLEAKAFMEGSDKIKGEIKDIFNGKKDLNTASPEAKQMLVDKGLATFNNGRLELKKNISKEEQKDFFDNFDDHLIGLYQRNPEFLSPDRSEGRGDMKDDTSHGTHSSDASMSKLLSSLNRYAGANLPPLLPITKESAKNLIESMRNELLLQAERNQENRDIQKDIESADLKDRIIKKEVLGREIRNEQISEEGLKNDILKADILLEELQKKGDIGALPFIETINKAISLIVTLEKIPGMKESPEFKTLVREVVSFIAKMTPAIGVNASIGGRIAGG